MRNEINKLRIYADKVFNDEIMCCEHPNIYIEVTNTEDETHLGANRAGFLYLAIQLLQLADSDYYGNHYHLDEAGAASMCDKPIVIGFVGDSIEDANFS